VVQNGPPGIESTRDALLMRVDSIAGRGEFDIVFVYESDVEENWKCQGAQKLSGLV
jgi:hypothetical protein